MNRGAVAFGVFTLIVGVGMGYFMYTHPEGLNPEWPIWAALLAPALFVLGGLHIIGAELNKTGLSSVTLRAILFCFWAVLNWAAFFTTHIQCRMAVSFLGAPIVDWYPTEADCRNSLRILVAILDALIVGLFALYAWHRHRISRNKPGVLP